MRKLSMHEIAQANKFIFDMYLKIGQGMSEDDFFGNCWMAYMEARKQYSYEMAFVQYWLDVERIMQEKIAEEKKYRNNVRRINANLSLDQTWGDYKETIGAILFPSHGNFANSIVFWDYVNRLEDKKIRIIRLITEREDDYDIMNKLHMSLEEYYQLKVEIKEDMREYYEF